MLPIRVVKATIRVGAYLTSNGEGCQLGRGCLCKGIIDSMTLDKNMKHLGYKSFP